jgi:fumarylacetoacetase
MIVWLYVRINLGRKNPLKLNDGSERKFIEDNDTVIIRGFCENNEVRIGFGEVSSQLLPPFIRQ